MSREIRAVIGITLGVAFIACGLGAAICHQMAGYQPRSTSARTIIEHEAQFERYYDPEDYLLSERGLALRRRARLFGRAAGGIVLLIIVWATWPT